MGSGLFIRRDRVLWFQPVWGERHMPEGLIVHRTGSFQGLRSAQSRRLQADGEDFLSTGWCVLLSLLRGRPRSRIVWFNRSRKGLKWELFTDVILQFTLVVVKCSVKGSHGSARRAKYFWHLEAHQRLRAGPCDWGWWEAGQQFMAEGAVISRMQYRLLRVVL